MQVLMQQVYTYATIDTMQAQAPAAPTNLHKN